MQSNTRKICEGEMMNMICSEHAECPIGNECAAGEPHEKNEDCECGCELGAVCEEVDSE